MTDDQSKIIERRTRMLEWSLTLRELLWSGTLDLDGVKSLVAEFTRAVEFEKRRSAA